MCQYSNDNNVNVYIGLGSNLDNPRQQIQQACQALTHIEKIQLQQVSSLYISKPLGSQDQPDYINAVAQLSTQLTPLCLLTALQTIENAQGRMRGKIRWQARTLDLDILLYGNQIIRHKQLQIPHSQMLKRAFVLYPLWEISGDFILPQGKSLRVYLQSVSQKDLQKLTS